MTHKRYVWGKNVRYFIKMLYMVTSVIDVRLHFIVQGLARS